MRRLCLVGVLMWGCSEDLRPVTDGGLDADTANETDTDTDTDTDADTDADSDSDADADTDTDTDTDTGDPLDCDTPISTPNIGWGGSTCLTGPITCDSVVEATTANGSTVFDKTHWDTWFCYGDDDITTNYDAAERAYELVVPDGRLATLTLETPCNALSLKVLRSQERCPPSNYPIVCDAGEVVNNSTQQLVDMFGGYTYQVIVDGKNGAEANFRLRVDCTP